MLLLLLLVRVAHNSRPEFLRMAISSEEVNYLGVYRYLLESGQRVLTVCAVFEWEGIFNHGLSWHMMTTVNGYTFNISFTSSLATRHTAHTCFESFLLTRTLQVSSTLPSLLGLRATPTSAVWRRGRSRLEHSLLSYRKECSMWRQRLALQRSGLCACVCVCVCVCCVLTSLCSCIYPTNSHH